MLKTKIYIISILSFLAIACEDIEDDFTRFDTEVEITEVEEEVDTSDVETYVDPTLCWDSIIWAQHDPFLNDIFTRYEDGWTGGDATYSIEIDGSSSLWIFGDTFLGSVREDRSRPPSPLINNSIVIQSGYDDFNTFYGGTESDPKAFLVPPESDWWYWPGDGHFEDGQLQLIMFAMKRQGSGMFGFEYAAIDLATLSYPDLEVISLERKMNFEGANFGANLFFHEGYTYIYGAYKDGFEKFLHVARVEGKDLSQEWEFLTSEREWSKDVKLSAPIFSNVSEQFSIIERSGTFYLMTQNYILGSQLYLYESSSVTGPFENRQTIYCTPETSDRIITYNAFVHEQFSTEDTLLISYNTNSLNFIDIFSNADNYRPYFVKITGWK